MKISKIVSILLASSIVFFNIGCGTTTDENSEETTSSTITGKVIDGPIYNAKVCVDYNFNEQCDDNESSSITDINGSYSLNNVDITTKAPIIVVPQNNTIDTTSKEQFTKKLAAPLQNGTVNINPITTLVGAKLYELKKDNNLSNKSINEIEKTVKEAIGINDNLVSIDITKYPKIYAMAVVLSKILPNKEQNLSEIKNKINFEKLKEGNLTGAIKDNNITKIIEELKKVDLNITIDSDIIQIVIKNAMKYNNTSILQSPNNWQKMTTEEFLTNNNFYKQNDEGLLIKFEKDYNFTDTQDNDGIIEQQNGSWSINDNVIQLNYFNGDELNVTFKMENPYIYNLEIVDSDNRYKDKVLVIPDEYLNDISKLPGITPLKESDIIGKTLILYEKNGEVDEFIFDSNGTYKENDETENKVVINNKWNIKNGVLELNGTSADSDKNYSAKIVKFDNYLFALINENGIERGYIFPANFESVSDYTDLNGVQTVSDFKSYIQKMYKISLFDTYTNNEIVGQTWYTDKDKNETIKFNDDSTFSDSWVEDGKTYTKIGNWSISDGVLVLDYDSDNYGGIKKVYIAKFNNGIVYVSLDVDGNVVNSGIVNNTNYPLTERLSNIWGYDWYKITAFYDGDTRYIGNDVIFNTDEEYIGLKANKKENQDSRAQVRAFLPNVKGFSADINLITDNIYSLFQILAISKGNINISKPIGDINNTSNLDFYAGLNLRKNSIYYWWSIYDSKTGKYYNGNVGGENYEYNLTNLVTEGSDVTVEVTSDNNSISYKVYNKANGNVIFNKSLNLSDINITNFKGFNVVSFRSDVRDNKANQNNDDAIGESLNYVNNFKVINDLNNDTIDKFLNSIDFTPNEITTSTFKGKKLIIDDLNVTVYFTSDGKFYARGEGNYSLDEKNNVLIFNEKEGNVIGYIAFNNLTNENADYAFDRIGDGISKGSLKIESFNETNFNPYPSYVNNGEKVVLDVEDDFLNLNTENKVQFNIKNDNGNGIQCTTNYASFEDFKNSFSDGELTLDASKNEISCVFLNNNNPISPTKQTEVIKFIDNNDGTYQVHMISGYFSGNDFNVTNIDDSLMYIDNN